MRIPQHFFASVTRLVSMHAPTQNLMIRCLNCFAGLLILPIFSGCADKPAEIVTYQVPAAANVAEIDTEKRAAAIRKRIAEEATLAQSEEQGKDREEQPPENSVKGRMLAAIIPKSPNAWFLKLSGPLDQVSPHVDAFRKFLSEMKFDGGNPKWIVPSGWTELPGDANRYATLQIPVSQNKPLELTITSLSWNAGIDLDDYLSANVNRWRGQMGLDPSRGQPLSKSLEQFPLASDSGNIVTAYFVDLEGTLGSGGMMPPFAARFAGKKRPPRSGNAKGPDMPFPLPPQMGKGAPATALQLKYDTPAGWQPGDRKPPRLAAFEIHDGEKRLDVTVSSAGGGKLANINRWRGQVDLPEITETELASQIQPIAVGALQGDYVRLVGPAEKNQTILGVSVNHGGKQMFIKLWGDSALAAKEQARFEAFVKSLKFSAEGNPHGQ